MTTGMAITCVQRIIQVTLESPSPVDCTIDTRLKPSSPSRLASISSRMPPVTNTTRNGKNIVNTDTTIVSRIADGKSSTCAREGNAQTHECMHAGAQDACLANASGPFATPAIRHARPQARTHTRTHAPQSAS